MGMYATYFMLEDTTSYLCSVTGHSSTARGGVQYFILNYLIRQHGKSFFFRQIAGALVGALCQDPVAY